MGYRSLRRQTLHYFARPHQGTRRQPLVSPAAWRGEDMRRRDDWIVPLDPSAVDELKRAVAHAEGLGRPLGELSAEDFPLPSLAPRIADWRREVRRGRGFVLVRGVPVAEWTQAQAEIFFWCFGLHFGEPGAQNPRNDLLGHVIDERTDESEDARYYRTNRHIAFHCDAADAVGLLCLRKAKSGGLSRIVSSVSVYNELLRRKPYLIERLYRPFYLDTHGEGGVDAIPITPCRYAGGELRMFWHCDYFGSAPRHRHVPAFSDDERELYDTVAEIAGSPRLYLDMDLQPGDVQILSNHTQLHSRTGYEDWPDPGQRRHLLRLWMSLPEPQPLNLRLLTLRAYAGLVGAMLREPIRERLVA